MAERLTELKVFLKTPFYKVNGQKNKVVNKLGQLEDMLEKYGIESVEELENIIINGLAMLDIQKINILKEMELKTDRDTWKRACELACEHIAEVEWFSCPETDDISESENEIKTLTKQSLNFFYQQAKKEMDE